MLESFNRETKEAISTDLLDITKLVEGQYYKDVICYVSSAGHGLSIKEMGFYKFQLKDYNGKMVSARIFELDDFIKMGTTLSGLKNRIICVNFIAQIYNGCWSLIIRHKMETVTDSDLKERGINIGIADFRGTMSGVDSKIINNLFHNTLKIDLDLNYDLDSFTSICNGKVGGYEFLMTSVLKSLIGYTHVDQEYNSRLYKSFALVYIFYNRVLKLTESKLYLDESRVIQLLGDLANYGGDSLSEGIGPATEVILSLINRGEPKHLVAHLIYAEIKQKKHLIDLMLQYSTIPMTVESQFGGDTLLRY